MRESALDWETQYADSRYSSNGVEYASVPFTYSGRILL